MPWALVGWHGHGHESLCWNGWYRHGSLEEMLIAGARKLFFSCAPVLLLHVDGGVLRSTVLLEIISV
jgi:hypothetical protein